MGNPRPHADAKPRRAQPLQPDRPVRDDQPPVSPETQAAKASKRTVSKQKTQSDAALKNVSQGYD